MIYLYSNAEMYVLLNITCATTFLDFNLNDIPEYMLIYIINKNEIIQAIQSNLNYI